jgi:hypothetical protein
MDFLDLAQHRFQELSSSLLRPMTTEASNTWEAWLRDDVSVVAAQQCNSQRFRNHVTWSLTHLAPGSKLPQRRLVQTAERSLVAAALALREAAQQPNDRSLAPPFDGELLSVIKWIAGRPWFDLACPEEFFTADRGLHLVATRSDCHSEFWASREPRVPLGDYVCRRGMFLRLEYFAQKIDAAWQRCFAHVAHVDYALAERIFSRKVALDQAIDALTKASHLGNEARLRDACVTLVQVYAAYMPEPQLDWLGFPANWPVTSGKIIRSTIVRPPVNMRMALGSPQNSDLKSVGRERHCILKSFGALRRRWLP